MKRLLKGGFLVSPTGVVEGDLLLDDERIAQMGPHLPTDGVDAVEDVSGCYLFPGFIDAHTHFDLPVCGTVTADDFSSGTRAAVCGGTTTVVDFATPNKGESLAFGLETWMNKAKNSAHCDYSFHMTIDDWTPQIQAELPNMIAAGITSFKMYLTYPAMMIGDGAVLEGLQAITALGGLVGVHCENAGVIDALIAQSKAAGNLAPSAHPRCRPAVLEAEAVARLLRIAQVANAPVMIVHLTNEDALEEVRRARTRGQTVYVETCPHYLTLDDSLYDQKEFLDSARYICAPPLRAKENQEVLWQAIAGGEIQTIGSDHCAFTLAQHEAGRADFTKIPGGLPGVEHRGILLYSQGVAQEKITLEQMCSVLSENPAKLYGLYPQKGVLAVGSDGDIVVYDPAVTTTLNAATALSAAGYTPYEGFETAGTIRQVYLRGALKVDSGVVSLGAKGQFIARHTALQ